MAAPYPIIVTRQIMPSARNRLKTYGYCCNNGFYPPRRRCGGPGSTPLPQGITPMTAMPFGIKPAHDEATIFDIVRRFAAYQLHLVEARSLLMPAFGISGEDNSRQGLIDYLDSILDRVHSREIDTETASSDIWDMVMAARSGDPDFDWLLDIGPE